MCSYCKRHNETEVPDPYHSGSQGFKKLLLDFLIFSVASFSPLMRYPALGDKELMAIVEKFILEQLNLIKVSISEIKVMNACSSVSCYCKNQVIKFYLC
ncbi:unnamed protein product [Ilex paraguariensis]|uniref:Uncharacterized protein n=1 Tax=Ilex paraguariensis TaxID=185542 RepID=A0ABC8T3F4_9AQUA